LFNHCISYLRNWSNEGYRCSILKILRSGLRDRLGIRYGYSTTALGGSVPTPKEGVRAEVVEV